MTDTLKDYSITDDVAEIVAEVAAALDAELYEAAKQKLTPRLGYRQSVIATALSDMRFTADDEREAWHQGFACYQPCNPLMFNLFAGQEMPGAHFSGGIANAWRASDEACQHVIALRDSLPKRLHLAVQHGFGVAELKAKEAIEAVTAE